MEQPPSGGWRAIFSNERVTRNLWMPKLDTGHKRLSAIPPTICPRSFSYLKLLFTWRPFHLPPVLLSFILFFHSTASPPTTATGSLWEKWLLPPRDTVPSAAYFSQWNLPTAGSGRNGSFLLVDPAYLCKTFN